MQKVHAVTEGRFGYLPRAVRMCLSFFLAVTPFAALCICGGCARDTQSFRHPEADLSSITHVAVIPFQNYTSSQYAGEKVTMIYIAELLSNVDIEVIEPGEVARVLQGDSIVGGQLSQSEIKSIGSALKANALIFGAVQEYGTVRVRNETYPVVSLSVRWVDAQTGTIIFMGTASEEGSPRVPIIDVGEEQLFSVLARKACNRLINMVR